MMMMMMMMIPWTYLPPPPLPSPFLLIEQAKLPRRILASDASTTVRQPGAAKAITMAFIIHFYAWLGSSIVLFLANAIHLFLPPWFVLPVAVSCLLLIDRYTNALPLFLLYSSPSYLISSMFSNAVFHTDHHIHTGMGCCIRYPWRSNIVFSRWPWWEFQTLM